MSILDMYNAAQGIYHRAYEGVQASSGSATVDYFDRPKDNPDGLSIDFNADLTDKKNVKPKTLCLKTNFKTNALKYYNTEYNSHILSLGDGFQALDTTTNAFNLYSPLMASTVADRTITLGPSIGTTYFSDPGQEQIKNPDGSIPSQFVEFRP